MYIFFRGNGAAMWRVMPHSAIVFATFDKYEKIIRQLQGENQHAIMSRFFAGAAAGATATVVTYPFDLLRARMAAHWNVEPKYSGYFSGLREISRTEGAAGLFRGLNPTLIGVLPYAGVSFATFETLKAKSMELMGIEKQTDIPIVLRLVLGGTAGLVAQTVAYPIHVVRRRMQTNPNLYTGTWQALVHIYRTEGVSGGLFKGVALTWLKAPIAVGISFCINDFLKAQMLERSEVDAALLAEHTSLGEEAIAPILSQPGVPRMSPMEQIFCGGFAGAVAKTVIAPADRIKILYQVNPDRKFTLSKAWKTASQIVTNNGVRGLWRGNMATMMRIIPHSGIGYMVFDRSERAIVTYTGQEKKTPLTRFFAGAVAGGTATLVSYPFDLLRARMAAHWGMKTPYSSYSSAVLGIMGKEGPLALYKGLVPTLLGVLPYSGISFGTFGTLKATVKQWLRLESDADIPAHLRLACGAVAGLVAQSATYPLDIVRRRMQVSGSGQQYTGIIDALTRIYNKEGFRGLYKGLSMNWIKGPVAVAVSFSMNDKLTQLMWDSKAAKADR